MRIVELKSQSVKIIYKPAVEQLKVGDFVSFKEDETHIIAQVLRINLTNDENNIAELSFLITTRYKKTALWRGEAVSSQAIVEKTSQTDIENFVNRYNNDIFELGSGNQDKPMRLSLKNFISPAFVGYENQKDNIAMIEHLIKKEDSLYDNKEAMQAVEGFFKNQVQIYDAADKLLDDLSNELDYLSHEEEANKALNRIRLLVRANAKFDYKCVPELSTLMTTVHEGHNRLLKAKREELLEIVRQCMAAVHTAAGSNLECKSVVLTADAFYDQRKQRIQELQSLALLDGLVPPMLTQKDDACAKIDVLTKPKTPVDPDPKKPDHEPKPPVKKIIKSYNRQIIFPAKRLETQSDLDAYMTQVRKQLETLMQNCDGIELK